MTVDRGLDDPAVIATLTRVARLPLPPERLAVVGPALKDMYASFDVLAAVPMGETPPQTAFDPRWR